MNKKLLTISIIGIFAIGLVTAIVGYYALLSITINVNQPIEITGDNQEIDCDAGDSCLGEAIRVSNDADGERIVNVSATQNENVTVSWIGKLNLTKKDTTTWTTVGEPIEITYTVVGEDFITTGIPEGYTLIYYKDDESNSDDEDRLQTAGVNGSIAIDLPHTNDWNIGDLANYCDYNNTYDDYNHCKGGKLWAVPNGDIVGGELTWTNMSNYYYETDLIYYFANADGQITVPAGSYIEFYPLVEVNSYANDGEVEIEVTIA